MIDHGKSDVMRVQEIQVATVEPNEQRPKLVDPRKRAFRRKPMAIDLCNEALRPLDSPAD